ncbi:hypothetical protein RRG08_006816 [Elysia crispata]|uniref:Uncharacterized protein n=1 Tax=Elysia crispata TaxID=231223 RepID=A0AAE1E6P5_9GAST|nr:hypothetical protein RRG08_006816 [Elysia crispata]
MVEVSGGEDEEVTLPFVRMVEVSGGEDEEVTKPFVRMVEVSGGEDEEVSGGEDEVVRMVEFSGGEDEEVTIPFVRMVEFSRGENEEVTLLFMPMVASVSPAQPSRQGYCLHHVILLSCAKLDHWIHWRYRTALRPVLAQTRMAAGLLSPHRRGESRLVLGKPSPINIMLAWATQSVSRYLYYTATIFRIQNVGCILFSASSTEHITVRLKYCAHTFCVSVLVALLSLTSPVSCPRARVGVVCVVVECSRLHLYGLAKGLEECVDILHLWGIPDCLRDIERQKQDAHVGIGSPRHVTSGVVRLETARHSHGITRSFWYSFTRYVTDVAVWLETVTGFAWHQTPLLA